MVFKKQKTKNKKQKTKTKTKSYLKVRQIMDRRKNKDRIELCEGEEEEIW